VLASLADETAEGRSILELARNTMNIALDRPAGATFIDFSAATRLSGVDLDGRRLRKGAIDSVVKFARQTTCGQPITEP
ncbi:hypothetical protein ABTE14_21040, partial [Acinetobacter baumannii]